MSEDGRGQGQSYERWAKIHNLKQAIRPDHLPTMRLSSRNGLKPPLPPIREMRQTGGELKARRAETARGKGVAATGACLCQGRAHPRGLKAQKSGARAACRQAGKAILSPAKPPPVFQGRGLTKAARPALQAGISSLSPRKDSLYNTYSEQKQFRGVADRQAEHRPDFAREKAAPQKGLSRNDKPSRMDYRQHQAAAALCMSAVATTRDCLLLDDGEPCVCVQSISYSLMCRWFRVAVLPLDEELAAALLCRGRRALRGLRGSLCPQIGNTARLRECEETQSRRAETKAKCRFRAFQTRINQGFFVGVQGYTTIYPFPEIRLMRITKPKKRHNTEEVILSLIISGQTPRCPPVFHPPPFPAENGFHRPPKLLYVFY